MMPDHWFCKCGNYLSYEFERVENMCGECQEAAIAKWQRMDDWRQFHGDYHDEQAAALNPERHE